MKTLESIISSAINYENGTAFLMSEYDRRSGKLLEEAAEYLKARKAGRKMSVSDETINILSEIDKIVYENNIDGEFELAKRCVDFVREFVNNERKDSNLEAYDYDMVCAMTLGSVNATMKAYLDKVSSQIVPQTKYYLEIFEQGKVVYREAAEDVVKKLDALNLFSIPDNPEMRTKEQKDALEKAYTDLKLAFGFKAAIGFPDTMEPDSIIDFNAGETGNHTKVIYNMCFKEFSIIQFATLRTGQWIYTNIKQSEEPWIFKCSVDLGLVGVSMDKLPENVRNKINNIDPGSMFGIEQLFMDLNMTALIDSPTISGVDESTMYYINAYFIQYYLKQVKEKSGDVILGYSITPQKSKSNKKYLIEPKDFRFYVSPYRENGKPAAKKKKLYTLNYIVICEDKEFPELRDINWNWVTEEEYKNRIKSGVISISKRRIYEFSKNEYIRLLKKLLYKPSVRMNIDDPFTIKWGYSISHDDETNPEFDDKYKFLYEKTEKASDTFVPVWGNIEMTYKVNSELRNYQTLDNRSVLECRVDISCWLHINIEGGVSEGTVHDTTTWYCIYIDVDEYGKLILTPEVKSKDNGTTFSISGWSSFWCIGLEDSMKEVQDNISNFIKGSEEFWKGEFKNWYNGNSVWYIPGDESLICKSPLFSESEDLTFDANYHM